MHRKRRGKRAQPFHQVQLQLRLPSAGKLSENKAVSEHSPRVLGPYRNRAGFRLVVIQGAHRKSITASTNEAAQQLKIDLLRAVSAQQEHTFAPALAEYVEHLQRTRGVLPATAVYISRRLGRFLPDTGSIRSLTAQQAAALYHAETQRITQRRSPVAVDSHRALLKRTKAFFAWAQARGYVSDDPFSGVSPVGKSRTGKPQLRIDEARLFMQTTLQCAQQGDALALGVLLLLLLGLRAGEVVNRQVRDVDDEGRILWISRGKTQNSRRRLQTPLVLIPLLQQQAKGKSAESLLFGTTSKGRPLPLDYLWHKVHALCQLAGVPRVCPHSLRGLHATLALEAGATGNLVATALGHGSFAITARHYADPDTLLDTQARRVESALAVTPHEATESEADRASENSSSAVLMQTISALRQQLSPEQLAQLGKLLADK